MDTDTDIVKSVKESWFGGASAQDERIADLEIPRVTESSLINELIAVGIAVGEGKLEKFILEEKIKDMQIRFLESYRNFLSIYSESQLPEIIDKEAQKIIKSYEEQDNALKELLLYFEDSETRHIAQGLHSLVSSFNKMTQANKNFERYQQAMGGKECPECCLINLPGEIYCKRCKYIYTLSVEEINKEFSLMSTVDIEQELESGGLLVPKHLSNLFGNYINVTRNELSIREFIGEIDWQLALLYRTKLKAEKVLFNETIGKAREGVIQTGWALMDGLNIVNIAMNKIRLCLITFDSRKMQEGWTELLYGTRKIMQGGPFYPLVDKQAKEDGLKIDEELKFFEDAY